MFEALKNHSSDATRACAELLQPYRSRNCFNPSLLFINGETLIAFRAYGDSSTKPFSAYLLSTDGEKTALLDLSETMKDFGIANVSDPKLFLLAGSLADFQYRVFKDFKQALLVESSSISRSSPGMRG